MIAHTNLAANDTIILDYRTARDTGLGGDNDTLSDLHVVSDLHEVIYLGAFANVSFAESSAIYTRIRTDLDIVLDHNSSDLGEFSVPICIPDITKAICSDRDSSMQNDIVTNRTTVLHKDIGMENAVAANSYIVPDLCTGS